MAGQSLFLKMLKRYVVPRNAEPLEYYLIDKDLRGLRSQGRLAGLKKALLVLINAQPFVTVTERAIQLGYGSNPNGWATLRHSLEREGLIIARTANTGRRGGTCAMLELTSKGKDQLKEMGMPVRELHGGLIHDYYMEQIIKARKSGDKKLEKNVRLPNGVIADILELGTQMSGVIEVIVSRNIQRDVDKIIRLAESYDYVIAAIDGKKLRGEFEEAAKRRWPGHVWQNTQILRVQDLF